MKELKKQPLGLLYKIYLDAEGPNAEDKFLLD